MPYMAFCDLSFILLKLSEIVLFESLAPLNKPLAKYTLKEKSFIRNKEH